MFMYACTDRHRAVMFPEPNPLAPARCIISRKNVFLSKIHLVNFCSKYLKHDLERCNKTSSKGSVLTGVSLRGGRWGFSPSIQALSPAYILEICIGVVWKTYEIPHLLCLDPWVPKKLMKPLS